MHIHLSDLVPVFDTDAVASQSEQTDKLGVVESKGAGNDVNLIDRLFFVAHVFLKTGKSFFHLFLKPSAEEAGHRHHWFLQVSKVGDEFGIERRLDVELDRVVTGGHGLDIPLDEVALGDLADVVGVDHDEEGDGAGDATDHESLILACLHFIRSESAGDLNESLSSAFEALRLSLFTGSVQEEPRPVGDGSVLLTLVFLQLGKDSCLVEVLAAVELIGRSIATGHAVVALRLALVDDADRDGGRVIFVLPSKLVDRASLAGKVDRSIGDTERHLPACGKGTTEVSQGVLGVGVVGKSLKSIVLGEDQAGGHTEDSDKEHHLAQLLDHVEVGVHAESCEKYNVLAISQRAGAFIQKMNNSASKIRLRANFERKTYRAKGMGFGQLRSPSWASSCRTSGGEQF